MGLVAAILLALANFPAGDARSGHSDSWLGWVAVLFGVGWLVWALLARRGPEALRAASVVVAGACAAGLVLVIVRTPTPDDRTSVDLSFPLSALGLGLGLLGAAAVLVGTLSRLRGTGPERELLSVPQRLGGGVVVAAAVTVLVLPMATVVAPTWTAAANLDATTTDQPPPPDRPPALDELASLGPAQPYRPHEGDVLATSGGVAIVGDPRVRMLDPVTGDERWSFRRSDLRIDPTTGGAYTAISQDGRWLAVSFTPAGRRDLALASGRDPHRFLVFDTLSGQLRAEPSWPERLAGVLAVTSDAVVVLREIDPGRGAQRSQLLELVALTDSGGVAWRRELPEGCRPERVEPVASELLVLYACHSPSGEITSYGLVLLDERGEPRWQVPVEVDQYGESATDAGYESRSAQPAMALGDDLVVLTVRVFYRNQDSGDEAEVRHHLSGLRLSDGEPVWDQSDLRFGESPRSRHPADWVLPPLVAGGTTVLLQVEREEQDEGARWPLRLVAVETATGAVVTHTLPQDSGGLPSHGGYPLVPALLAGGRLAVVDYHARGAGCTLTVWDMATGAQMAGPSLLPLEQVDERWCWRVPALAEAPGALVLPVAPEPSLHQEDTQLFALR